MPVAGWGGWGYASALRTSGSEPPSRPGLPPSRHAVRPAAPALPASGLRPPDAARAGAGPSRATHAGTRRDRRRAPRAPLTSRPRCTAPPDRVPAPRQSPSHRRSPRPRLGGTLLSGAARPTRSARVSAHGTRAGAQPAPRSPQKVGAGPAGGQGPRQSGEMHLCAESRAGKQDTRPGFGLRQKIPAPVQLGPNLPTRDREGGRRHTRFQNTCATLHGPRCRLAAAEATGVGTLPHTSPLTPGPPVTCSCASSPPDLLPSHARSVASRTAGHGGTPPLCVLAGGMETSQPPRNGAGRRQRAGAADPGTGPRRPAGSRTPGRLPHSTVTTAHCIPCTATLVRHCISKMFSPQRKR